MGCVCEHTGTHTLYICTVYIHPCMYACVCIGCVYSYIYGLAIYQVHIYLQMKCNVITVMHNVNVSVRTKPTILTITQKGSWQVFVFSFIPEQLGRKKINIEESETLMGHKSFLNEPKGFQFGSITMAFSILLNNCFGKETTFNGITH